MWDDFRLDLFALLYSVNVSMANFLDSMIDYPNSKMYVFGLFDKLNELGILNSVQLEKYKTHVENLERFDEDMDLD